MGFLDWLSDRCDDISYQAGISEGEYYACQELDERLCKVEERLEELEKALGNKEKDDIHLAEDYTRQ